MFISLTFIVFSDARTAPRFQLFTKNLIHGYTNYFLRDYPQINKETTPRPI